MSSVGSKSKKEAYDKTFSKPENSNVMEYAYFPGCSLDATAREYDISFRATASAVDIRLREIPGWICCGSTPAYLTDSILASVLSIKNLIWPEKENLNVITPCASCFSRLTLANMKVQSNTETLSKINRIINSDYQGRVRILNTLDVLGRAEVLEIIKHRTKKKLSGLKVACYYGCLLTRPRKIDVPDAENPDSMDKICAAAGAETVEWPHKTECCGAGFSISKTEIVIKLTHDILKMAKAAGADCIAVACPLCQVNLDMRQKRIEKGYKIKIDLPIMYVTQITGLALRIPGKDLGLNKLIVEPYELLKRKGLLDD